MASNIEGCREVDVAMAHLAAANKQAESATQLFGLVAQILGFFQFAANQLVAGLGKTLRDSASKMMELAQSQVACFQH